MKKFTKIEENQALNNAEETLFKSDYFNIVRKNDWEYDANPTDYVIAVLYLANHMELVFRLEEVPPYKHKHPEFDRFVTTISGTKQADESHDECLFREIYEEAGIILPKSYSDHKLVNTLFISKGSTAKYYIYWVPILDKDYRMERAPGDGTTTEANSTAFRINIKQLNALKPVDMITAYALELAKNELGMK